MAQKGFSVVGVIFLLVLLLIACFYGVYILFSALGITSQMDTSSWVITESDYLAYKHPQSWQTVKQISDDQTQEHYAFTIPSISFPNNPITGDLIYRPTGEMAADICTEESKLNADQFSYIYSKPEGVKCIYTKKPPGNGVSEGKTYIYAFHDFDVTRTVTLTVHVPPWTIADPQLEKQLDTVIDSVTLK